MTSRSLGYNSYFQPTKLPACRLWLDAQDVNADGTTPADLSAVSTWVDKSANQNNATQGTGAAQPIYFDDYQGAGAALLFDSTKYLEGVFSDLKTDQDWTFAVFGRTITLATVQAAFFIGAITGTADGIGIGHLDNTNTLMFVWGAAGSTVAGTPVDTSYSQMGTYDLSTNTVLSYLDNSPGTPDSAGSTLTLTSPDNFYVGRATPPGGPTWNGSIQEIAVYNTLLNTEQLTRLNEYFFDKWVP